MVEKKIKKSSLAISDLDSKSVDELKKLVKDIGITDIKATGKRGNIVKANYVRAILDHQAKKSKKKSIKVKSPKKASPVKKAKKASPKKKSPVKKAKKIKISPAQGKKVSSVEKLKLADVLIALKKYEKYKGLSDAEIKKKVGKGSLAKVVDLRQELLNLRAKSSPKKASPVKKTKKASPPKKTKKSPKKAKTPSPVKAKTPSPVKKAKKIKISPAQGKKVSSVEKLKLADVLIALKKYEKYKGLSDAEIKKKVGKGSLAKVVDLRQELLNLRAKSSPKSSPKKASPVKKTKKSPKKYSPGKKAKESIRDMIYHKMRENSFNIEKDKIKNVESLVQKYDAGELKSDYVGNDVYTNILHISQVGLYGGIYTKFPDVYLLQLHITSYTAWDDDIRAFKNDKLVEALWDKTENTIYFLDESNNNINNVFWNFFNVQPKIVKKTQFKLTERPKEAIKLSSPLVKKTKKSPKKASPVKAKTPSPAKKAKTPSPVKKVKKAKKSVIVKIRYAFKEKGKVYDGEVKLDVKYKSTLLSVYAQATRDINASIENIGLSHEYNVQTYTLSQNGKLLTWDDMDKFVGKFDNRTFDIVEDILSPKKSPAKLSPSKLKCLDRAKFTGKICDTKTGKYIGKNKKDGNPRGLKKLQEDIGAGFVYDKEYDLVGTQEDIDAHIRYWKSEKSPQKSAKKSYTFSDQSPAKSFSEILEEQEVIKRSPKSKLSPQKSKSCAAKDMTSFDNYSKCSDDQLCDVFTGKCVDDSMSNKRGKYMLKAEGQNTIMGDRETIEKLQGILGGEIVHEPSSFTKKSKKQKAASPERTTTAISTADVLGKESVKLQGTKADIWETFTTCLEEQKRLEEERKQK